MRACLLACEWAIQSRAWQPDYLGTPGAGSTARREHAERTVFVRMVHSRPITSNEDVTQYRADWAALEIPTW